jgi:hypothetical protein
VLVAASRVLQAVQPGGLSPERDAWRVTDQRPFLDGLVDALVARTLLASDEDAAEFARLRLLSRVGIWERRKDRLTRRQLLLAYERFADSSKYGALIRSAESATSRDTDDGPPFVVAGSMREVQPEINLLVSPIPDRLVYDDPPGTPRWEAQASGGAA